MNKELKEIINSFIELGDKVIEQEEEIERLNNIINKAIEYLNKECMYNEDLGYCDDLWCGQVQELVNILKGDDKQ